MKVIKSKKPYLLILAIFLSIAAVDSYLWGEKAEHLVIEIESSEENLANTLQNFEHLLLNYDED